MRLVKIFLSPGQGSGAAFVNPAFVKNVWSRPGHTTIVDVGVRALETAESAESVVMRMTADAMDAGAPRA